MKNKGNLIVTMKNGEVKKIPCGIVENARRVKVLCVGIYHELPLKKKYGGTIYLKDIEKLEVEGDVQNEERKIIK